MAEQPATRAVPHTARLSLTYLIGVGASVILIEALPVPRLVQDLQYTLVGLSVVVAILIGIRRYQPRAKLAWYVMAAGQWLWVVADTTLNWQLDVLHTEAFPTISDFFYLLGYPTFAVGLGLLLKGAARTRRDRGPLLDTLTVTAALTLLSWVLLARPTIESLSQSPGAAAVAAAYPAGDILLVAVLVRLVSAPGGRSFAFKLLFAALLLLITADTFSVAFDLFATNTVSVIEYLWLLSYVAWGAAALHPSMAKLSETGINPERRFRGLRLLALILATTMAPSILATQKITGVPVDVWAVAIGAVVMSLLVVVRMNMAIDQISGAHHALEVLQDELSVLATHDPLTGLANRTQSMRLVAGALGRSRRQGNTVGLLFIDLDGFKKINDEHGHRSGDEVLREVSRRMELQVRDGDFVGRLGGDEFVVGIEDVPDEDAASVLGQRLIAAVSEPIRIDDDLVVKVGASIGIALGRGGETNVETLIHEADLAVYQAKAGGRARVEVFNSTARAALRKRNDLERAIANAIAEDELVLYYQPIVETVTGKVACYEALVRWNRPGHGLVGPDEFLPLAETSGLICHLDVWVLDAAVAQLTLWNLERGDRELQIAVNVSARHISQTRIRTEVANALRGGGVDPGQLVIEITETAIMDATAAASNLEALHELGVEISLDDFGTGYQSSAQLARLPIDVLKIDREFVLASDASSRSLLELMVKTAQTFGIRVVAEGVERRAQLDLVREFGCEYVQGFYIGEPLPADEVIGSDHGRVLAG